MWIPIKRLVATNVVMKIEAVRLTYLKSLLSKII